MEGAPAVFLPYFYSSAPLLLLRGGTQDITIPPFIPNPLTRASKNHLALLGAPGPQRREAGDITEPSTARNIFAYFRGSFSWVDGDPDYSRGVRVVSIPTSVPHLAFTFSLARRSACRAFPSWLCSSCPVHCPCGTGA